MLENLIKVFQFKITESVAAAGRFVATAGIKATKNNPKQKFLRPQQQRAAPAAVKETRTALGCVRSASGCVRSGPWLRPGWLLAAPAAVSVFSVCFVSHRLNLAAAEV